MKQAEIQKKQLNELVLWDKNPRAIKEVDYERLKNLIKELGLFKPFVINQDNIILGGNMRYRVCKDLGYKEVFVSVVKTNNEAEMFSYALADNDRAGYYEEDKVAELVLQNPTLKLDLHKLDLGQLTPVEDLLERFGPSLEEDEPPELEEGEAISKLGEVYQLGRHRVMCGDSTKIEDVEKLMNGEKADMVFTDPPYGIDFKSEKGKKIKGDDLESDEMMNFNNCWQRISYQVVKDDCFMMVWQSPRFFHLLNLYGEWKLFRLYTMYKSNRISFPHGAWINKTEPCLIFTKGEPKISEENYLDDCFVYVHDKESHKDSNVGHPTPKPVTMVSENIRAVVKEDNIVLDLFGGSGSTLIACEQLNRTCYMMELDPKYVDVIRKRYHKFVTGSEEGWEINTPKLNV
jgi:DNA modification methylase